MKRLSLLFSALASLGLACGKQPAPEAGARFTLEQLAARFPADLGAATVDVSGYPARAQAGYEVFLSVCGQCHSPARALNAPESTRAEWDRHVRRMHDKTLAYGWWTEFGKKDADKILDFLEHDGKARKFVEKEAFAAEARRLEALFKDVEAERVRLQIEDGRREARPAPPYAGVKG